jgi:hypothetical protein
VINEVYGHTVSDFYHSWNCGTSSFCSGTPSGIGFNGILNYGLPVFYDKIKRLIIILRRGFFEPRRLLHGLML